MGMGRETSLADYAHVTVNNVFLPRPINLTVQKHKSRRCLAGESAPGERGAKQERKPREARRCRPGCHRAAGAHIAHSSQPRHGEDRHGTL